MMTGKRRSKPTQKYADYKADLNGNNNANDMEEKMLQDAPNICSFQNFPQLRSDIVHTTTENGDTRLTSESGVRVLHNTGSNIGIGRGKGKGRGGGVFSPTIKRGRNSIQQSSPVKPGSCRSFIDLQAHRTNVNDVMNSYMNTLASAVEDSSCDKVVAVLANTDTVASPNTYTEIKYVENIEVVHVDASTE